jgi:hypothetical protein
MQHFRVHGFGTAFVLEFRSDRCSQTFLQPVQAIMAKGGDKRRLEANAKHLQKLQIAIAAANVSSAH